MEQEREKTKAVLGCFLKLEKNIEIIEKAIFDISNADVDFYNRIVYQTVGDIMKKKKLIDVVEAIKNNRVAWNHSLFDDEKKRLNDQNEFIENPFEVEEGVLECKCGSKKVFSYSKQIRSADEPMTTFATCVICKKQWTYSG